MISFGIELEYEHVADPAGLGRALFEAGLTTTPERRPQGLTWKRTPTSWRYETDQSLDQASGVELVSHPVILGHPSEEAFYEEELPRVLELVAEYGGRPTDSTALHVHASAKTLRDDRYAWHALRRAIQKRLKHHQEAGLRPKADFTVPEISRHATAAGVRRALAGKRSFLSTAYWPQRGTVEWRVPNSTLDQDAIRDEIAWLIDSIRSASAERRAISRYQSGRGFALHEIGLEMAA